MNAFPKKFCLHMQSEREVFPVVAVMAFDGQPWHVPAELAVIPSAYVSTGHLQSVTAEVDGDDCAARTALVGHCLHPLRLVAVVVAVP